MEIEYIANHNPKTLRRKFLIIRFSSIGDLFLTTPVARVLKETYPDAEIHYLTKKKFRFVLEPFPYIDKILTFDGKLNDALKQVKKEKFTDIIDLHHNVRSNFIRRRVNAKAGVIKKHNLAKWLYVKWKISFLPKSHVIDRYFDAAAFCGIKNDLKGPDIIIPNHDQFTLPGLYKGGFHACVIGGTHFTKRMPIEKWAELISQLKKPVILLGGQEEERAGSHLEKKFPDKVLSYCGQLRLYQSVSILQQATDVFTHDTGLMHMAAAMQKKMMVIWGNTDPVLGLGPYSGQNQTPFEHAMVKPLPCHPCSKIGYESCPKKHFHCMQNQNTQWMAAWANL